MRLSTKMVLVTLGLVMVPLILLTASLFLLNVYRPRTLQSSYGQEDTNIMNINVIHRFDDLMNHLEGMLRERESEDLLKADVIASLDRALGDDKAYLLAYTEECYYNGGSGNEDVLRYVSDPDTFENRDKLYFAGLSHPYLIGARRFQTADVEGNLYLVCDVSGSLPSVGQIIFLITISVLALVGGSLLMLSWQRIKFAKPLKQLEEAAQSISEGNLDFQLAPESDDEFGSLIAGFEVMRSHLKENAEAKLRYEEDNRILISNISHDLKTPITAIKGYVEGLRDGVASSPEKQAKYLATIYNKADEMDRLVDQLSFYSLVDSNQVPYQFVRIPAKDYFEDCAAELGAELETRDFVFRCRNTIPEGVFMICDPEQLGRVIHNIVSNSVKYRDRSKTENRIELNLTQEGETIVAALSDNGLGIPQADLPHIFDRFFRSDTSRSSSTGGNGIGLSIVKKIVEDHDGSVRAESKEGEGTRLILRLPVSKEEV